MNPLFKERLKDAGVTTLAFIIAMLIVLVSIALFILALYGLDKLYHHLDDYVLLGIIGLYILWQLGKGLYWLFIEPFKKQNKEDLED